MKQNKRIMSQYISKNVDYELSFHPQYLVIFVLDIYYSKCNIVNKLKE